MRLFVKVKVCHVCHDALGAENGSEGVAAARGLEMTADTCMKVTVLRG